jgi:hypothetical protein
MRYVLPALPVSGSRGNRARRREAARLAQRQAPRGGGKAQRQDAAGCCGALFCKQSFFALRVLVTQANAAMRTNQQATEPQQEFCTHQNMLAE